MITKKEMKFGLAIIKGNSFKTSCVCDAIELFRCNLINSFIDIEDLSLLILVNLNMLTSD